MSQLHNDFARLILGRVQEELDNIFQGMKLGFDGLSIFSHFRSCKCCDLLSFGNVTPFVLKVAQSLLNSVITSPVIRKTSSIYTCLKCGLDYIGKTEREVRERCSEYRLPIEKKIFFQGVHKHMNEVVVFE